MGKERISRAKMATVLVTARFCEPSSEWHIAEDGIGAPRGICCDAATPRRDTARLNVAGNARVRFGCTVAECGLFAP
jgi:hypothetical protein